MATAAWLAASQKAATDPAFLLSIYDGTNTFRCLSRSCSTITEPVALLLVDAFDSGVDPLTRKTSIGEIQIDVSAAWFRPIAINHRLVGAKITITNGFADLAEADFKGHFCGVIAKNPEQIDANTVRITAESVLSILGRATISGSWFNEHPLKILYAGDGTGILEAGGIPAAMIDAASFVPSAWPSIENLCFNRACSFFSGWYGSSVFDGNALELADSLCEIIGGSLVVSGDGVVSFSLYDRSRAVTDNWTVDDIEPGTFAIEQDEIICNCVMLEAKYDDGDMDFRADRTDTASIAALAYPGSTERVIQHTITADKWQCGAAVLPVVIGVSDTSIQIRHTIGMAGMSDIYPVASQPAGYQVSASHPAYYHVETIGKPGSPQEIVKCTAISGHTGRTINQSVAADGTLMSDDTYSSATLTVARGQLGSMALAFDSGTAGGYQTNVAHDITAFVRTADEILRRFAYGRRPIALETTMQKDWIGVGDFVTITWPDYVEYGVDGLTSSTKWEVIRKEPSPFGSPPKISWGLVYVDTTYTPTDGFRQNYGKQRAPRYSDVLTAASEDFARSYIVSGLVGSSVYGLSGKVTSGSASVGSKRISLRSDQTITFTARRDTYVTLGIETGMLGMREVANGAAVPTKNNTEIWVAKFVTNASAITSVDNTIKETLPLDYDKVKDGSTWKKVGGVGANNKAGSTSIDTGAVISTHIGSGAVTSGKIGVGAVGVHQSNQYDRRVSLGRNAAFGQRTRG